MSSDGNLRPLFREYLPMFHWQSVETAITGGGVPDSNYCLAGYEGWIEFKQTKAWSVHIKPAQVGWIERRIRVGGNVLVAVRQMCEGNKRSPRCDDLWIFNGRYVRDLKVGGLTATAQNALLHTCGGPTLWDWLKVRQSLLQTS